MDAKVAITSADLRAALTLRYPEKSHALMFEVAPATGGGTRYADAVCVGLWSSHGHQIEGFEIKVSRSDWLNELKQPEKSEPVMRYCHRWWLVCAPGVAAAAELPPGWGMLELQTGGSLKARVQAPKREPIPVTLPFFASLVRRGAVPDNAVIEARLARVRADLRTAIRDEMDRERRHELSSRQQRAMEALEQIEKLKSDTGIDLMNWEFSDDWFAAVRLVRTLGADYGFSSLPGLRKALMGCIEAIDKAPFVPAATREEGCHG